MIFEKVVKTCGFVMIVKGKTVFKDAVYVKADESRVIVT